MYKVNYYSTSIILVLIAMNSAVAEDKDLLKINIELNNFKSISKNYCGKKIKKEIKDEFSNNTAGYLSTNRNKYKLTLSNGSIEDPIMKYFNKKTLSVPTLKQGKFNSLIKIKDELDIKQPLFFSAIMLKAEKIKIGKALCQIKLNFKFMNGGDSEIHKDVNNIDYENPLKAKFTITCNENNKISKCNLQGNGTHIQHIF